MLTEQDQLFLKQHFPFWNKLSDAEQTLLTKHSFHRSYNKSSLIYNGSIECLGVILVLNGILRASLLSEDGKDITLYRLFQGDVCILSASCLLNNITFDISINVIEEAEIIIIPYHYISSIIEQNTEIANFVQDITYHRFSDVMWTLEQILFMSLDERLAAYLYDECLQTKSNVLHTTHATIALNIGSAREAVSRMLKYFEDEGIIKLNRGEIEIIDRPLLFSYTHK